MSDTPGPERNDWRNRAGKKQPSPLTVTRRLLRYVSSSFYDGEVDDRGIGSISVPDEWREGHKFSVPEMLVFNTMNRQYPGESVPFSRAFRAEDLDDENLGVSFWLSQEARTELGDEALMADVGRMAEELALSLGLQADDLEARYLFPSEETQQKMGPSAGVGICLVAQNHRRQDAENAFQLIYKTQRALEEEKKPQWEFLRGRSFEQYAKSSSFRPGRSALGIRDVTNTREDYLPLLPVEVKNHEFTIPLEPKQARYLDGEGTALDELKFTARHCWRSKDTPPAKGMGLAMCLGPSFYSAYRDDIDDAYDADLQPKLKVACDILSRRCKGPIYAHFVNLESFVMHAHERAPSMVIFTTDAAHQNLMHPGGELEHQIESLSQFSHRMFRPDASGKNSSGR